MQNTEFLVFDTEFLVFNTEFIIFTHHLAVDDLAVLLDAATTGNLCNYGELWKTVENSGKLWKRLTL